MAASLEARRRPLKLDPVFGDVQRIAQMRALSTKGNLVAWRRRYLLEHHGPAVVDEVAARLEGEARELLVDPPMHFAWVPFGGLMDLDRAILEGPMAGDLDRMCAFGNAIGKGDLSTVYRLLIRMAGTPHKVVRKFPDVCASYFKPSAVAEIVDEGPQASGSRQRPRAPALPVRPRHRRLDFRRARADRRAGSTGRAHRLRPPRRRALHLRNPVELIRCGGAGRR
jgi:hypothetical protein